MVIQGSLYSRIQYISTYPSKDESLNFDTVLACTVNHALCSCEVARTDSFVVLPRIKPKNRLSFWLGLTPEDYT